MAQNHKTIEQPERNCRHHEEIDCRDAIGMIGQKGPLANAEQIFRMQYGMTMVRMTPQLRKPLNRIT